MFPKTEATALQKINKRKYKQPIIHSFEMVTGFRAIFSVI